MEHGDEDKGWGLRRKKMNSREIEKAKWKKQVANERWANI